MLVIGNVLLCATSISVVCFGKHRSLGRVEDSGLHWIEPQCRVTRLAAWRGHPRKPAVPSSPGSAPRPPFEGMTPGKVIGWMLARPETLSSGAREQLDRITQLDDTLA